MKGLLSAYTDAANPLGPKQTVKITQEDTSKTSKYKKAHVVRQEVSHSFSVYITNNVQLNYNKLKLCCFRPFKCDFCETRFYRRNVLM